MQDHLEKALAQFLGVTPARGPLWGRIEHLGAPSPRITTIAAGRTDAGVHATAQVVHFDTDIARDSNAWVRGTNTYLHHAARVVWAHETAPDFHARYSARSRTYRYLLLNDAVQPAVLRGRVGWYHRTLDMDRMARAMQLVEGEHDFSAFRDAECQAKSPVRRMLEAKVTRERNLIVFTFRADAFLHHMVRNLVGAMVYVGSSRHEPEWIAELLRARDRTAAAPTFPPDGLYLTAVEYDPAFGLPAFRPPPMLDLQP